MRAFFAMIVATTLLASQSASAHTKSIGYYNAGPGSVTFWFGSWHTYVPPFLEGSFNLVGINGNPYPSTTVPFSLTTGTKPPLLVDGVNNFYACYSHPTGFCPTDEDNTGGSKWQGVTMNGLPPGEYRFTYIPIANPSQDWDPATEGVRTNTFFLPGSVVGGSPAPQGCGETRKHPVIKVPENDCIVSGLGDTTFFGGTVWAPDSMRWEAIMGGAWTFDSGVGSSINSGSNPNKPPGYHQTMEGWTGVDLTLPDPLPYFRRTTTCAISGYSMWAGVTSAEANQLCYAGGQGYGNRWLMAMEKTFAYPGGGGGCVQFNYDYRVECEPNSDFLCVEIDTTGTGAAPSIILASHTGVESGTGTYQLCPGTLMRSEPGNFVIRFVAYSDDSYSDQDGGFPTSCGLGVVDNIQLGGSVADFSDFTTGMDGWSQVVFSTSVGDFSNLVDRNTDLPPPVTLCACGLADSVLVFFDELGQHPLDQDNIACSPWIDLKDAGFQGRPGRLIRYDIYAEMPLANYVVAQFQARWYPEICNSNGLISRSGFEASGPLCLYGDTPFCTGSGSSLVEDLSAVIPASAEQIQIAVGVVNLCRTSPMGVLCTGVSNTTPWFDNITFGVYGGAGQPLVSIDSIDLLQDAFATDGTLNPASTGRMDVNRIRHGLRPGPGTSLGDTIVVSGDGGNTEVRMVFHVRPGLFTNMAALAAWAAKWTPEPALGPAWYSARMDTVEVGGVVYPGRWMDTFHEADPGFSGTDRTPDPRDPSELANEILPDHILTPGSRIDYYFKARYIPPDPRNPGGQQWWIFPDETGCRPRLEVEILPSSMGADSSWNCTLYVDHHDDRDRDQQILEEQGLTSSLGVGSNNAENTRFDRWDVRAASIGQLSFGRPIQTYYGCSLIQMFGYKNAVWHTANLSTKQLTAEDANVLIPWLNLQAIGNNRFWGSGNNLARSIDEPSAVTFMLNTLGVRYTCNTVRQVNCPTASPADPTFCLPTQNVPGSEFSTGINTSYRGSGCPDLASFDLINRNPAVTTAKGQLRYVKGTTAYDFASVTNHNTTGVDFKTVLDGAAVGLARTTPADPNDPAQCVDTGASIIRTDNVMDWFGSSLKCKAPYSIGDVPRIQDPPVHRFVTAMGDARPNPLNRKTRISFTTGTEGGVVTIQVFDVAGRLVKTLVDGPLAAGIHEVVWDGRGPRGDEVASGLYFYRMTADHGSFTSAKKLILLR